MYIIYCLLINRFTISDILTPEDIFIHYQRDIKIIGFYNSIKVLVVIISKSKKLLIIIFLNKDILYSLLVNFSQLIVGVKLRLLL